MINYSIFFQIVHTIQPLSLLFVTISIFLLFQKKSNWYFLLLRAKIVFLFSPKSDFQTPKKGVTFGNLKKKVNFCFIKRKKMNYILFEDKTATHLFPLTFTRPVGELRVGITTLKEKWETHLQASCSYLTRDYLQKKYFLKCEEDNLLINASIIPNQELLHEILLLKKGENLRQGEVLCAIRLDDKEVEHFLKNTEKKGKEYKGKLLKINYLYDIFTLNGEIIEQDFALLTHHRKSETLSSTNTVLGKNKVFVEKGAKVEYSILNTENGNIYIGKNSEVMENSVIRGPFALCEQSTVKIASKIYENTTIGPHSKVGGELNNVVIQAYSNKGHDGFLGNSVIGQWCNLGADTNNSNLKNNYAEVKLWNYVSEEFEKTGLQFCGLIMGDHTKCGINTMFNTGTVVGVGANIFGSGFPRNFIPSFIWGGISDFKEMRIEKFFETAKTMMSRRNINLDEKEKEILQHIFQTTSKYRQAL